LNWCDEVVLRANVKTKPLATCRWASWLGATVSIGLTAAYLYVIVRNGAYVTPAAAAGRIAIPCYGQWTTRSMLTAVPNMAYLFAGHGSYPEQRREMRSPRDFNKAFTLLYACHTPLVFACALLGFHAFGNMASANYLENLEPGSLSRFAVYVTLATSPLSLVLTQMVLLLSVEVPLGILPTDMLTNSSPQESGDIMPTVCTRWLRRIPPLLFRLVFRSLYVGSLLFWAELLAGGGLAIYVNIAGAIGLSAMTYWLPFVFSLTLRWGSLSFGLRALYILGAVSGVFIAIAGLLLNIEALLAPEVRPFHAQCRQGAHFWGGDMWNPRLSLTSDAFQTLVVGCCVNGSTCGQ